VHGFHDDRDGELLAVLSIYTLLYNDVGNILLKVVQLVLSFQVTHLHISLVQYFMNYILFGEVFSENFEVTLLGYLSFGDVSEYFVDLKDLVDVSFSFRAPIEGLVSVASELKLFAALLETDDGDIGELDLIDSLLQALTHVLFLFLENILSILTAD
jgi:hypothetical protein